MLRSVLIFVVLALLAPAAAEARGTRVWADDPVVEHVPDAGGDYGEATIARVGDDYVQCYRQRNTGAKWCRRIVYANSQVTTETPYSLGPGGTGINVQRQIPCSTSITVDGKPAFARASFTPTGSNLQLAWGAISDGSTYGATNAGEIVTKVAGTWTTWSTVASTVAPGELVYSSTPYQMGCAADPSSNVFAVTWRQGTGGNANTRGMACQVDDNTGTISCGAENTNLGITGHDGPRTTWLGTHSTLGDIFLLASGRSANQVCVLQPYRVSGTTLTPMTAQTTNCGTGEPNANHVAVCSAHHEDQTDTEMRFLFSPLYKSNHWRANIGRFNPDTDSFTLPTSAGVDLWDIAPGAASGYPKCLEAEDDKFLVMSLVGQGTTAVGAHSAAVCHVDWDTDFLECQTGQSVGWGNWTDSSGSHRFRPDMAIGGDRLDDARPLVVSSSSAATASNSITATAGVYQSHGTHVVYQESFEAGESVDDTFGLQSRWDTSAGVGTFDVVHDRPPQLVGNEYALRVRAETGQVAERCITLPFTADELSVRFRMRSGVDHEDLPVVEMRAADGTPQCLVEKTGGSREALVYHGGNHNECQTSLNSGTVCDADPDICVAEGESGGEETNIPLCNPAVLARNAFSPQWDTPGTDNAYQLHYRYLGPRTVECGLWRNGKLRGSNIRDTGQCVGTTTGEEDGYVCADDTGCAAFGGTCSDGPFPVKKVKTVCFGVLDTVTTSKVDLDLDDLDISYAIDGRWERFEALHPNSTTQFPGPWARTNCAEGHDCVDDAAIPPYTDNGASFSTDSAVSNLDFSRFGLTDMQALAEGESITGLSFEGGVSVASSFSANRYVNETGLNFAGFSVPSGLANWRHASIPGRTVIDHGGVLVSGLDKADFDAAEMFVRHDGTDSHTDLELETAAMVVRVAMPIPPDILRAREVNRDGRVTCAYVADSQLNDAGFDDEFRAKVPGCDNVYQCSMGGAKLNNYAYRQCMKGAYVHEFCEVDADCDEGPPIAGACDYPYKTIMDGHLAFQPDAAFLFKCRATAGDLGYRVDHLSVQSGWTNNLNISTADDFHWPWVGVCATASASDPEHGTACTIDDVRKQHNGNFDFAGINVRGSPNNNQKVCMTPGPNFGLFCGGPGCRGGTRDGKQCKFGNDPVQCPGGGTCVLRETAQSGNAGCDGGNSQLVDHPDLCWTACSAVHGATQNVGQGCGTDADCGGAVGSCRQKDKQIEHGPNWTDRLFNSCQRPPEGSSSSCPGHCLQRTSLEWFKVWHADMMLYAKGLNEDDGSACGATICSYEGGATQNEGRPCGSDAFCGGAVGSCVPAYPECNDINYIIGQAWETAEGDYRDHTTLIGNGLCRKRLGATQNDNDFCPDDAHCGGAPGSCEPYSCFDRGQVQNFQLQNWLRQVRCHPNFVPSNSVSGCLDMIDLKAEFRRRCDDGKRMACMTEIIHQTRLTDSTAQGGPKTWGKDTTVTGVTVSSDLFAACYNGFCDGDETDTYFSCDCRNAVEPLPTCTDPSCFPGTQAVRIAQNSTDRLEDVDFQIGGLPGYQMFAYWRWHTANDGQFQTLIGANNLSDNFRFAATIGVTGDTWDTGLNPTGYGDLSGMSCNITPNTTNVWAMGIVATGTGQAVAGKRWLIWEETAPGVWTERCDMQNGNTSKGEMKLYVGNGNAPTTFDQDTSSDILYFWFDDADLALDANSAALKTWMTDHVGGSVDPALVRNVYSFNTTDAVTEPDIGSSADLTIQGGVRQSGAALWSDYGSCTGELCL